MGRSLKVRSVAEVKRWYDEGRTYVWMSEEHERKYGVAVSPQAFSEIRHVEGWEPRVKRNLSLIPWMVKPEHRFHYDLIQLRFLSRRLDGKTVGDDDVERNLDAWLRHLKAANVVVAYDPDSAEGFSHVPREPRDRDGLIRQPERVTTRRPRD